MRIIYITSALNSSDFSEFQKSWKKPLNPSNQNFHNKLIRSLSNFAEINVISLRPYNKSLCSYKDLSFKSFKEGNINWNYLKVNKNKYIQILSFDNNSLKLAKKMVNKESMILVDTINPKTIRMANNIANKYKLPVIGVLTDSPYNITGINKEYADKIINNCSNFKGYISLTDELNLLFNKYQNSHITLEGIVENDSKILSIDDNRYFFFGGAMLERYGVYELIKAFKSIKENVQLLICGHHYDEEKIFSAIGEDKRIKFLGILPVEQVIELESHALACINPRPYSEELDKLSIPSKTLEYLASCSLTISAKNTKLHAYFKDNIIWADNGDEKGLKEAMEKVLKFNDEEIKNLASKSQSKVIELFSINSVSKKLEPFLSQFLK